MIYKTHTIYLDNAASSFPKPTSVTEKMTRMLKHNTANPGRSGHRLSAAASRIVFDTRSLAADFFGISGHEENVVFTFNATLAINTVLKGTLKRGDHVIISDVEHNSVLRPLTELQKDGISYSVATTEPDDAITVENFKKLIVPQTKMIFVSHASNVGGMILPVEKLGKLCKDHGIYFGVDASQTAGHVPIDLIKMNISVLCAPGHKGLFGPQGTGLIVINPDSDIKISPIVFGGTGSESLLYTQPNTLPEMLESGTLNTVGIAGLYEGIRFCSERQHQISDRIHHLTDIIFGELPNLPYISVFSPENKNAGIVSFRVAGIDSETVARFLDTYGVCVRGGFHCSALFHKKVGTQSDGLVRVSPSVFNCEKDIITFINSIKRLKIQKNALDFQNEN